MVTRRAVAFMACVAAPVSLAGKSAPVAPTDMAKMNDFVMAYNKYVASIEHGLLSVKDWGKVLAAWSRMTDE